MAGPCKLEFKFKLEKQRIIQLDLLLLWDLLCSYLIVFLTKSHKIGDKKWVVSATCHKDKICWPVRAQVEPF